VHPRLLFLAIKTEIFFCLLFSWETGEWERCSARCGSRGYQSRRVLCQQIVQGYPTVLDNSYFSGPVPSAIQECQGPDVCPDWFIGEWSQVIHQ